MVHVGVDQHKRYSQVAVMDAQGLVLDRRRLEHWDRDGMMDYFAQWGADGSAVLEAGAHWYWLYDLMEECFEEVTLADPSGVRYMADRKIKTDKVDAELLAELDRIGHLPTAHVPTREVRDRRELHRLRIFLVRLSTALKNRVHAVLDKLGIEHPHSDLFGKGGRELLESLELRWPYGLQLEACLAVLDSVKAQIERVRTELRGILKTDQRAELLQSVPGIGELLCYLVLYEIGDIGRFATHKKFASYCALTPTTHQSGATLWHGHTGRRGNLYLKWAFTEAAHTAARKDSALGAFYRRQKARKGAGRAALAVAHKLAVATYHILKRKEPYRYNHLSKVHLGKPVVILGRP